PRIWRLRAGCETYSRSAARPKLSSSATATNARRWRSSMPSGACGKGSTLPVWPMRQVSLARPGTVMQSVHRRVARSDFPFTRGWCSLAGVVVADMTLRFGSLRVHTTVHWPRVETVSLAVVLTDELSPTDSWVEDCVVVGLAAGVPTTSALAALRWVSEHL